MDGFCRLEDTLYAVDTPFLKKGAYVRSYLVAGDAGWAMIDGGVVGTDQQVLTLLREQGIKDTDLKLILLTHAHGDHVGGVRALKDATGCLVAVERHGAELMRDLSLMFWDFMRAFPEQIPMPDERKQAWFSIAGQSTNPDIQFEGDQFRLDLGNIKLDSRAAPGHSDDSICIYEPSRRWLFTGDSICGRGPFQEAPCYRDVTVYRDTLLRMRALPIENLYAAHFPVMGPEEARAFLDASVEAVDSIGGIVRATLKSQSKAWTLEEVTRAVAPQIGKDFMIQLLFTVKAHLLDLARQGAVGVWGSEGAMYSYIGD